MSDELDLYSNGGQVVPFVPDQPLAPSPADTWGLEDADFITDYHPAPSSSDLPPEVERNVAQLNVMFTNDFLQLGHPLSHIEQSVAFFKSMLKKPPTKMPVKKHQYPMWQLRADPLFMAFCNFAWTIGCTPQFIQSVCWWLGEVEARIDSATHQQVSSAAQGRAPSTSNPEDALTDEQWEAVVKANDNARSATMQRLKALWQDSFQANFAMVNTYYGNLPLNEQKHLDGYTSGWIKGTNTFEVVHGLYQQAIGGGSLPRAGGDIAAEIALCEKTMRQNRKAWNKDEQLQSRYRELLRMRSGR